jgi:ribosome-binding factor A
MIRGKLTRALSLRTAPLVRFHLDEKLKKELEVLELLRQVERERQAKASGEAAPQDTQEE